MQIRLVDDIGQGSRTQLQSDVEKPGSLLLSKVSNNYTDVSRSGDEKISLVYHLDDRRSL
jgi:hypothetical protein